MSILGAQQIYATIKRSSKYYGQHDGSVPFPVHFQPSWDGYIVNGNDNRYRLRDVWLQVQTVDGSYMRISK
jgi:hypothetical protein